MFGKNRAQEDVQLWRTQSDKKGNQYWETFPPYDVEKKIKQLDPEGLGIAFANSVQSVKDPTEVTSEETEHFISEINDHIAQLKNWYVEGIAGINKSIKELGVNRDIEREIDQIPHDFEQNVTNDLNRFGRDQRKQIEARESAKINLTTFRAEHRLSREADYPESTLFTIALLFAALVVEGVLNSYFFMNASDLGLLGGFLNAMFASAVNVGWSFLIGWGFLRMLNQRERINKIKQNFVKGMGGALVLFSVGLLGALHLTIAHFREQAMRNPEFELFEAFSVMLKDPWNINDMESFFLIIIGSIISIVAVVKGYNSSDHHFGYAKADKRLKQANEAMDEDLNELHEKIQQHHAHAKLSISTKLKNIENMIDDLQSITPDINAFFECIGAYHEQAMQGGYALISRFRNAYNEIVQSNALPFSENIVIDQITTIDREKGKEKVLKSVESQIDQLTKIMKGLETRQEVIHETLREIHKKYSADEEIDGLLKKAEENVRKSALSIDQTGEEDEQVEYVGAR